MRNFIIGLSILFFVLSGLIVLKRINMSVDNSGFSNTPTTQKPLAIAPEFEEILEQFSREQAANRAMIEKLQGNITTLEAKLADKAEISPEIVISEAPAKEKITLSVIGKGIFGRGKIVEKEALMNVVDEIIPDILAYPDHRVLIEGHTCNIGTPEYNKDLSLRRANAVATMLASKGISHERITFTGYGETRPVASNDTYEGRVQNRRVEVKLVSADKEF